MATDTIELTNVGPLKSASLPYLPEGGVVVLRGAQGIGKSIALDALEAAATGKGKPPLRDGATWGEVRAFGVTMKLGRTTRRSGEPEVVSLEGRLSVADLVSPPIKDPVAADRRRIAALVTLSGVEAATATFADLLNAGQLSQLEAACSVEDDLLSMATKAKRILEAAARSAEQQSEHAKGQAQSLVEDLDPAIAGAPTIQAAQNQLEAAIRMESTWVEQSKAANEAIEKAAQARKEIEAAEANATCNAVPAANQTLRDAEAATEICQDAVNVWHNQLLEAQRRCGEAKNTQKAAEQDRQAAVEFERVIDAWEGQVQSAEGVERVSYDVLADASAKVADARETVQRATLKQKADEDTERAKEHRERFRTLAREAESLRESAKETESVLTDAVGRLGTPLRVDDGRLILDTARGPTPFGELSSGERWVLAIDIACHAVGERGVLFIPQWAWGELQPANKLLIAVRLRKRTVLAYAIEATDDEEMTAEPFEP